MVVYLNIIQILVSAALIALVILQSKGGSLSRMFGGESSIYRSRRGIEKTIFNFTVGLIVLFVVVSIASVMVSR